MKTTAALGNLIVRVKIRNSTLSHYVGEKTSILMMPTIIGDIQYGPLMYSMHLTLLKIYFAFSFFFYLEVHSKNTTQWILNKAIKIESVFLCFYTDFTCY